VRSSAHTQDHWREIKRLVTQNEFAPKKETTERKKKDSPIIEELCLPKNGGDAREKKENDGPWGRKKPC
jgi:hypothetical protein